MARPGIIVGTIRSTSPSAKSILEAKLPPSLVTLELHDGQSARLDMSMPQSKAWANILDSVQRTKQAVYLKIDPQTGKVADLLLPRAVKVASLKPANREADIEVELVISEMRHYLRRANPDYNKLLKTLENALKTEVPVLVTDSRDRQEIVDVRPIPETVAVPSYLSASLIQPTPPKEPRTLSEKKRPQTRKGGAK